MMKKALCTLALSFALALCLPFTAFADYSEGYLYYTVQDDSITITGCFGQSEEITVPASIAGDPVNTIAAGAFVGHSNLKKVYLPDTVETVEEGAIGANVTVVFNYNTTEPEEYVPSTPEGETLTNGAVATSEGSFEEATTSADLDSSTSSAKSTTKTASGATTASSKSNTSSLFSNNSGAVIGLIVVVAVVAAVVFVLVSRKRKAQAESGSAGFNARNASDDVYKRAKHGR